MAAATDDALVSELKVEGGQLSIAGRDLTALPEAVAAQFGNKVTALDLSYNLLTTVDHLARFPNLTSLVLDNNELGDTFVLPPLPQLRTLSLNNNKIEDLGRLIDNLRQACPDLHLLSLLKNPACPNDLLGGDDEDYNRYRLRVVYRLTSLRFLDSTPVSATEKKEAARVGPFLKVARPSEDGQRKPSTDQETSGAAAAPTSSASAASSKEYAALSSDLTPEGEHSGTFGMSKYVYYGRHSEGNRFIRNSDL